MYVYLKHLNHSAVHQKLTQHCKSTMLQLGKWQHQIKSSMKTPAVPSLNHSIAQPYRESTSTLCTVMAQLEATAALTGKVELHLYCPVICTSACLLTCTFLWGTGGGTSGTWLVLTTVLKIRVGTRTRSFLRMLPWAPSLLTPSVLASITVCIPH